MKIGFDMDEVIADTMNKYLDFYNLKTGKKVKINDLKYYNHWENLAISGTRDEAIKNFDDFYDSDSFERIGLIDGAEKGIEKLSENNELFIITSRPLRFKEKTERFVCKYFSKIPIQLFYSGDFYNQHDMGKASICAREDLDIFIEDNLEYAVSCSEKGIKTFLLNKPWNQGESNGVIRVYNWDEILKKINKLNMMNKEI